MQDRHTIFLLCRDALLGRLYRRIQAGYIQDRHINFLFFIFYFLSANDADSAD